MSEDTVSVIIPTYRRLETLKRALAAVAVMEGPVTEVLVIVRKDDDADTYDWLVAHPDATPGLVVLPVFVPGQVQALNAGLDRAKGSYIAIFDDDAFPHKDWLTRLLVHFEQPDVGIAGGRDIVFEHEKPVPVTTVQYAGYRTFYGNLIGGHHRVVGPPRDVDSIKGCNLIIRADAIGTLRFDTRLLGKGVQMGNDSRFCDGISQGGWRIVLDPSAKVDHHAAVRAGHQQDHYSVRRCFEDTANFVAIAFCNLGLLGRVRYIAFRVLFGTRECPGFYFLAHGLLKRPKSLPSILWGGWRGFIAGYRLSRVLKQPAGEVRRCEYSKDGGVIDAAGISSKKIPVLLAPNIRSATGS